MKEHVAAPVDWSSFEQPKWNQPGAVESALNALWQLREPDGFDEHYNRILYCLGNNHAGTLFPVAVPAVDALAEFVRDGAHVQGRRCALEVLIDVLSFHPDRDFGSLDFGGGGEAPLEDWVAGRCLAAAETVREVMDEWNDAELLRSAGEFLRHVEEMGDSSEKR